MRHDPDERPAAAIAKTTRWIINGLATMLVAGFGWLKFEGLEVVPIVKEIPAAVILQIALALYFSCWVAGTITDTNFQEMVYTTAPHGGKFPKKGFLICLLLAAIFGIMCWVQTARQFAIVLTLFWFVNIGGWMYLTRSLLPSAINSSRKKERDAKNYAGVRKLEIVQEHICGNWQWRRFAAGGAVIAATDALVFSPALRNAARNLSRNISNDLLIALCLLGYILVMEGWIWYKRLEVMISLKFIKTHCRSQCQS
jgi:hypothetical protein